MSRPDQSPPTAAGGFGGFRAHVSLVLFSGGLSALVLAAAVLPQGGPEAWLTGSSTTEAQEASRVALTSLESARAVLSQDSLPPEVRLQEARRRLGEGAGALSVLAAPRPAAGYAGRWAPVVVLMLGLAGLAGWLRRTWVGPIEALERQAWRHIHSGAPLELEVGRGGRDARALARLVEALVSYGARTAQHRAEAERAARAELEDRLRGMAEGDLRRPVPEREELALSRAVEGARIGLGRCVARLHAEASSVADASEGMSRASRRMAVAHREQHEALNRLLESAAVAEPELEGVRTRLEEGLGALRAFTRDLQRSVHQHRAELSVAARRLTELRSLAAELGAAERRLAAVEDCLGLLDEFRRRPSEGANEPEGAKVLSTRAALALRRGRDAIEGLKQDLQRLRSDTAQVAETLAEASKGAPVPVAELEPGVVRAIQDAAHRLMRTEEGLLEALRTLERGAADMGEGAAALWEQQSRLRDAGPRLARSLAALRLDDHLESVALERLARLESDLVVAEDGGPSAMGRAGAAALLEAAKASRARLNRLLAQTEAALEIVRGV